MKNTLLEIINNDPSVRKSASRYLYKNQPQLWAQILDATNFLPEDAQPKQRVWHIINDCYERPKCPITGEFVKWHENRYLGTYNRKATVELLKMTGKYVNKFSEESNEKRRKGNLRAVKNGRKYRDKSTYDDTAKENAKKTFLKNYGVTIQVKLRRLEEKSQINLLNEERLLNTYDLYEACMSKQSDIIPIKIGSSTLIPSIQND